MKKINWKIRFQNPLFVAMFVSSIVLPIITYCGMSPEEITSWAVLFDILFEAAQNPYLLVLILYNVYTTVVDPTTKGLWDSQLVIDKTKENKDAIGLEQIKELLDDYDEPSE